MLPEQPEGRMEMAGGYICNTEGWKQEDLKAGRSGTRRTSDALIQSMNSVMRFLNFTSEDNKLPSLDTTVWISGHSRTYMRNVAIKE